MRLILSEKSNISEQVMIFKFSSQKELRFRAGQYLRYELPHDDPDDRGIFRFFTISSAPHEEKIYITTRVLKEGGSSFKKKLSALGPGDSIYAYGPSGDFTLQHEDIPALFIAGGIGITPFRSIILDLFHNNRLKDIYLLYCTGDKIIPFKDTFDGIAQEDKGLNISYVVYPKLCDLDLIEKEVPDFKDRLIYISGPIGMVKSIENTLKDEGISEKNIKLDYFPGYKS